MEITGKRNQALLRLQASFEGHRIHHLSDDSSDASLVVLQTMMVVWQDLFAMLLSSKFIHRKVPPLRVLGSCATHADFSTDETLS